MKIAFTETNVLMSENAEDLFKEYDKVYTHISIIEELDDINHDKKPESQHKAYKARRAMSLVDKYEGSQLEIITYESDYEIPECLYLNKKDNRIIKTAGVLYEQDNTIVFVTEDKNLTLKSRALKIPCRRWNHEKPEGMYTGIREVFIPEQEYVNLMEGLDKNPYSLYPNEYLIINNINNTNNNNQYLLMWNSRYFEEVKVKPISNKYISKINPLDIYQKAFIHMLQNDNVKIKITDSVYGAGKTFLMLHWAIQMIDKGKFNKLYFVKSDSPPKGRKEYPTLPGGINEKSSGLLGVLRDITSEDNLTDILLRNEKLEILPIQFAKGRSLSNSILFINEAQDFSPSEMEKLLSRIGEGSVGLLDGSTRQIDNRNCLRRNGLSIASNNFKDKETSAQVNLVSDFRSDISKMVGQMDWKD